jgi:uncharacterized protein YihD (DUF1040 family)
LLFIISWKIILPLILLCLLPLPAYFRMYFEKRAYISSLYVIKKLADKHGFNAKLDLRKEDFLSQFKDASYYFMWVFPGLRKEFDDALIKIKDNKRPFEDKVFDILDYLIDKS